MSSIFYNITNKVKKYFKPPLQNNTKDKLTPPLKEGLPQEKSHEVSVAPQNKSKSNNNGYSYGWDHYSFNWNRPSTSQKPNHLPSLPQIQKSEKKIHSDETQKCETRKQSKRSRYSYGWDHRSFDWSFSKKA